MQQCSNVVKTDVVENTQYIELVKKVNAFQTSDTSNLVKKTGYDTKNGKKEKKLDHDYNNEYITAQDSNRLTEEKFFARLAQANLATKGDIADFVKETDSDKKIKNYQQKQN